MFPSSVPDQCLTRPLNSMFSVWFQMLGSYPSPQQKYHYGFLTNVGAVGGIFEFIFFFVKIVSQKFSAVVSHTIFTCFFCLCQNSQPLGRQGCSLFETRFDNCHVQCCTVCRGQRSSILRLGGLSMVLGKLKLLRGFLRDCGYMVYEPFEATWRLPLLRPLENLGGCNTTIGFPYYGCIKNMGHVSCKNFQRKLKFFSQKKPKRFFERKQAWDTTQKRRPKAAKNAKENEEAWEPRRRQPWAAKKDHYKPRQAWKTRPQGPPMFPLHLFARFCPSPWPQRFHFFLPLYYM